MTVVTPGERTLAEWRRRGYGIWEAMIIVEGYDQEFKILLPGHFDEDFAWRYAEYLLSKQIQESLAHCHIKTLIKCT